MTVPLPDTSLHLPFPTPPDPGQTMLVAPGILWVRLALPFRLDHVNIYLIEDGAGYAVFDTGLGDDATKAIWTGLLDGILRDRPPTRLIVSHCHPDHVGMAGWLCDQLGVALAMSQTDYLSALNIFLDPQALDSEPYRSFYLGHGLAPDVTASLLALGNRYLRMVIGLPRIFRRLIAGEVLRIGARDFAVLSGGGHAPEQIMLHCAADGVLLCADQVLVRISPNISVQAMDPEGDPLGIFLRSLAELKSHIPADTLVLPGHNLPFIGLHPRIDELAAHHASRCAAILAACADESLTPAELVPVVFRRPIEDPHQMGFAFSEALAHVNLLRRQGQLQPHGRGYRTVPV
jgi:glyoxylase-like metal-dependent hydrolase (beta-lactamase superfamily II)